MTQAERIREFYRDNPMAGSKEVAEVLDISAGTVRATISKDVAANRCVRIDGGGLDYSNYFNASNELSELRDYKNDIRHEMVEVLVSAMRNETDSDKLRMIVKEINKLLKEITR